MTEKFVWASSAAAHTQAHAHAHTDGRLRKFDARGSGWVKGTGSTINPFKLQRRPSIRRSLPRPVSNYPSARFLSRGPPVHLNPSRTLASFHRARTKRPRIQKNWCIESRFAINLARISPEIIRRAPRLTSAHSIIKPTRDINSCRFESWFHSLSLCKTRRLKDKTRWIPRFNRILYIFRQNGNKRTVEEEQCRKRLQLSRFQP